MIFYINFLSNLCSEEIFLIKNEHNIEWLKFLEQDAGFKLKFKFSDKLNAGKNDKESIFLLEKSSKECSYYNSYFENIDNIVIENKNIYKEQINDLHSFIGKNINITDDLNNMTRDSIFFSDSPNSIPDVKYIFSNSDPMDIFVNYPELIPAPFEKFTPDLLFNEVIVIDKTYSIKDSKQSYLDFMPAWRGKERKLYMNISNKVNEEEVEKLFLNKLKSN